MHQDGQGVSHMHLPGYLGPPKKDNWVPANLKLVNAASCVKHNGKCLARFGIDLKCLEPKWWQRTRVHVSSTIHEVLPEVGRD